MINFLKKLFGKKPSAVVAPVVEEKVEKVVAPAPAKKPAARRAPAKKATPSKAEKKPAPAKKPAAPRRGRKPKAM